MRNLKTGSLVTLKRDFEREVQGYPMDGQGNADYQKPVRCDLNGRQVEILQQQPGEVAVKFDNTLFFISSERLSL